MSAELIDFSEFARREPSAHLHNEEPAEILYLPIIKIKAPHILDSEEEVRAAIVPPEQDR